MGLPVMESWVRPDMAEGGDESDVRPDGAAARDRDFAGLVERQSALMFRVAYALLRNSHDAEDAVQEAVLKLYRGEAWQRIENEKAFLARTVWRVALDRRPAKAGVMQDVAAMDLADGAASPEACAVDGQERACLKRLIDALPDDLRQVLLLSAVEEMTSREVGAAIGIPEGTVRTRLMRAKAELKRRYEREQGRQR